MKNDSALLDSFPDDQGQDNRIYESRNLGWKFLFRWHNTECMESGTLILECKDGRYEALADEVILNDKCFEKCTELYEGFVR